MKKLVLASVMTLMSMSLISAPLLRAQDSSTITIKNPAEFNAYQMATGETNPPSRASALESFLQTYPNSVVKEAVLNDLIDTYQRMQNADKTLSAASRLLEIDPTNMKAIYMSVLIQKAQCAKTHDAQTCNDAGALALKGLAVAKPAGASDAEWQKVTGATYPVFYSAIAQDDIVAKKDITAGISEYRKELMLYSADQTKSGPGLWDTLQLAEAYTELTPPDPVQAIWFYARAWNYAVPLRKQIEGRLDYYYITFHGNLDGLDTVKSLAADTVFPPATYTVAPKPTPMQIAHNVIATTPDLTTLNLEDKEYILANASPEDAAKLWAVLKDQMTPVPGIVTDATASAIKVTVIKHERKYDFLINLTTPVSYQTLPADDAAFAAKKAFILTNGIGADTDKVATLLNEDTGVEPKVEIQPVLSQIKVAVTKDAQAAKVADFIVNLAKPLDDPKEIPAVGFVYGIPPAATLIGTYDSYKPVAATGTRGATAEIVLRAGLVQPPIKKPVAKRKPAAGHRK